MNKRTAVLVGLAVVAVGGGAVSAAEALNGSSAHPPAAKSTALPSPRSTASCGTVFDPPAGIRPASGTCTPAVSHPIVLLPYRH